MFSRLSKSISALQQLCPLCRYGNSNELGICWVCFHDLPRCPPVNIRLHMAQPLQGVRLVLCALWYMAEVRDWVAEFKFRGRSAEAKAMALLMSAQAIQLYRHEQVKLPDYLVPVPMTNRAWAARGYNQAQLLAEALSQLLGIPVLHATQRIKQTKKVHRLGAVGRKEALEKSFVSVGRLPRGTRIALIDDVLTTGATLGAITSVLPRVGVIVDAWTLAYTPPPMLNEMRN